MKLRVESIVALCYHFVHPCSFPGQKGAKNPKGGTLQLLRPYETLFFAAPDITDEALDALITKLEGAVTRYGGQVEKVNRWGKRPLAYPVEKHNEGYYVLIDFKGSKDDLRELERFYLINQSVLRFMTTVKPQ